MLKKYRIMMDMEQFNKYEKHNLLHIHTLADLKQMKHVFSEFKQYYIKRLPNIYVRKDILTKIMNSRDTIKIIDEKVDYTQASHKLRIINMRLERYIMKKNKFSRLIIKCNKIIQRKLKQSGLKYFADFIQNFSKKLVKKI